METLDLFERLGVALALGAMIGAERGWSERGEAEGRRVAGLRTFAISGLLGGLWMLLAERVGEVVLGFAFVVYSAVILAARLRAVERTADYGITTVVAAMLTFALGALSVAGEMEVAAAGAVATALLLGSKQPLHELLQRIDQEELLAVLKLLAMTLVLLPVLPDRGYGPWNALNPYTMWLMVILVGAISFLGYAAVRVGGARLGVPLAGLLGGLASSTAVALTFSRRGGADAKHADLYGFSIGMASVTMFPRMLAIIAVVSTATAQALLWPLLAATAAGYVTALALWRFRISHEDFSTPRLSNPFEFATALQFGVLLAAVMLLSQALQHWLGDTGIYLAGATAGLSDVDAISLSLAGMTPQQIAPPLAAAGIALAAVSNSLVKVAMALVFGGRAVGGAAALILGASLAAGAAAWAFV
ncbi:MAG TPA: MgtC/SapB family protein [Alphaproteobacteria bacterium]|nr:MgtC/SapB family protein [Alphaproteobacteria bacterium]